MTQPLLFLFDWGPRYINGHHCARFETVGLTTAPADSRGSLNFPEEGATLTAVACALSGIEAARRLSGLQFTMSFVSIPDLS